MFIESANAIVEEAFSEEVEDSTDNRRIIEKAVREVLSEDNWSREAGECTEYWDRVMGAKFVHDGETEAGRGPTAMDIFRMFSSHGMRRPQGVSIKTGIRPVKRIELTTGLEALEGLLSAAYRGAALPTLCFYPERGGLACLFDAFEVIRNFGEIEAPVDGGYKRGQSPVVYFRWVTRNSGGSGQSPSARMRKTWDFSQGPIVDKYISNGFRDIPARKWISPTRVAYLQMCINVAPLLKSGEIQYTRVQLESLGDYLDVNWDSRWFMDS